MHIIRHIASPSSKWSGYIISQQLRLLNLDKLALDYMRNFQVKYNKKIKIEVLLFMQRLHPLIAFLLFLELFLLIYCIFLQFYVFLFELVRIQQKTFL